ncbi:hypothetical protein [Bradyrhizobium sp. AUGA SZCCT0431]|uniref:hypothetical protein n=1 Tax=Bradyrhizobium sp. AUGA SZCCT0431 TaxID=2807674 RepID=UPI001BA88ECB|nr:hypothetical protein [Bradyrhizobium sp. AUGA SZCCT0431]MBR1146260.1 hypothetical protein [Bradyrhizobium sp. AUGA SZCCT0431]
MKKFGLVLAALGAIIIGVPSIASAQTVVIKRGSGYHQGHHHSHGARAEYRGHRDRGYHRGHRGHGHHDKVVIIKKHRY